MLNPHYPPIDRQTTHWSLAYLQERRDGMRAFMENREPNRTPPGLDD